MGMRSRTASVAHRRKPLGNASYDRSSADGSGQAVCGLRTSPRGVIGLVAPLASWRRRDCGVLVDRTRQSVVAVWLVQVPLAGECWTPPNGGLRRRTSLVC